MRNTRATLTAVVAIGALAVAPIAAHACSQYNAASTAQAGDPTLAMIREIQAEMAAPFADLDRILAAQDAAMNAMVRQIHAMSVPALRAPAAIRVAIPAGNGPVSTVMISSVSNGQGMCSETVTYTYGPDGKPRVTVQKTGNACGNATVGNGPTPVFTAPQPVEPHAPRTIQVKGPTLPVRHYIRG